MTPASIIAFSTGAALVILSAALVLTVFRIVRGPTLPDRIIGLDMLVAVAIGMIAVVALRTGFNLYIDIAIALGLVGFLATIAFARFILARGLDPEKRWDPRSGAGSAVKAKGARTGTARAAKGGRKGRR